MRLRGALRLLGVGIGDRGRRFAIHRVRRTDVDFSEQLLVICSHQPRETSIPSVKYIPIADGELSGGVTVFAAPVTSDAGATP
jgi:hypothetical protein